MAQLSAEKIVFGRVIGNGLAGQVFQATYENKMYAFKVYTLLGEERDGHETRVMRTKDYLIKEVLPICSTPHENIIHLHGYCLTEPKIGLLLELCQGGSLAQLCAQLSNAIYSERIVIDWAFQIAAALVAISYKYIHRDIKPDNVLILQKVCLCALSDPNRVDPETNPPNMMAHNYEANGKCRTCEGTAIDRLKLKLSDFGLSRPKDLPKNEFRTAGTFEYMSPESYKSKEYSEKSDVWSFGIMLYELLARVRPYSHIIDFNQRHLIPFHVARGDPQLSLEPSDRISPFCQGLIDDCLSRDANARPTFHQIWVALRRYRSTLPRIVYG